MTMEVVMENEQDEDVVKCNSCFQAMDTDCGDYFTDPRDGEVYCIDCGTVCDDCNEIYRFDRNEDRFRSICNNCEENWYYCERCSAPTHADYIITVDDCEQWCDSCSQDYSEYCAGHDMYESEPCSRRDSALIHSYDYNPYIGWRYNGFQEGDSSFNMKEWKTKTFFGVELEVECLDGDLDDAATAVLEHFNNSTSINDERVVYLKQDGSLEYGFEIVTQPMTFDFAMSLDWSILNTLRDMNYRSWKGGACGIHVHVSRTAFKDRQHLWKFTQLINGNERKCELLAGRNSERWSNYDKKTSSKIVLGKEYPHRYSAVNLLNSMTVEVRIFRGSLRVERVPMAIQFVESCVEYTRDLTINQVARGELDWSLYEAFVRSNPSKYKELITIIDERVK
jgi:transcription initiation factor TFIIIB Brf1 subunit/transcription initiation factor TFIIB